MLHFTPSKTRKRHAFIDKTLENYGRALDNIGSQGEYVSHEEITLARYILENFTVPNVRLGVLSTTHVTSDEHLPIWAAYPHESALLGPSMATLHPMQIASIEKRYPKVTLENYTRPRFPFSLRLLPFVFRNSPYATISRLHLSDQTSAQGCLHTRPTIVCNMGSTLTRNKTSSTSPSYLHHEITHVQQSLDDPLLPPLTNSEYDNLIIEQEVHAYRQEASMAKELIKQGAPPSCSDMDCTNSPCSLGLTVASLTDDVYKTFKDDPPTRLAYAKSILVEAGLLKYITP